MLRKIQVKVLDGRIGKELPMPSYTTDGSAGMDLHACLDEPLVIQPGETRLIGTGIAIYMGDPQLCAMILPRSGLGHKHGMCILGRRNNMAINLDPSGRTPPLPERIPRKLPLHQSSLWQRGRTQSARCARRCQLHTIIMSRRSSTISFRADSSTAPRFSSL